MIRTLRKARIQKIWKHFGSHPQYLPHVLPFGIYYLTYIAEYFTFPGFYWWAPILAFPFAAIIMILSPILICRKRNTKYGIARLRMD